MLETSLQYRRKGPTGNDFLETLAVRPNSRNIFGADGAAINVKLGSAFTDFKFLTTQTTAAFGYDDMFIVVGTGTEVIARSITGVGQNTQSQASTPADGDNILLTPAANVAMSHVISATIGATLRMVVRPGATALATMFLSVGLNENVTDADPTGTAGEGAQFLFDPTQEVSTGLTAAQHANWILAHKVNGADTFTATSIPVVAKDYDLKIVLGLDLKAVYYIDGVAVGTGPALTAGDTVKVFLGAELTATPAGQADFDTRFVLLERNIGG